MVGLCLLGLAMICWPAGPRLFVPGRFMPDPFLPGRFVPDLFVPAAGAASRIVGGRCRWLAKLQLGGGRGGWLFGGFAISALAVPAGVAPTCAALLLTTTVALLVSGEVHRRGADKELSTLLVATRTLAREVRTGASPVTAVLATAAAHPACAAAMNQLATAVVGHRTGRPVDRGSTDVPAPRPDERADVVTRLADGWNLSARYGVPWAALIDTVALDLAERQRAAALRNAQVAGPRMSGYVLAVMPALGVLLGAGMGADPVHVLLHTGVGAVLLLVGSALTCLGLAWTASIVRSAPAGRVK